MSSNLLGKSTPLMNVAGGNNTAAIFAQSKLFDYVFDYIDTHALNDVAREAYWCVCNCVEMSNVDQRIELIKDKNLTARVAMMLKECKQNPKITKIVLICVEKVLDCSKFFPNKANDNPRITFELEGGIETLEELQSSPNIEVFSIAQKIVINHNKAIDDEGLTF